MRTDAPPRHAHPDTRELTLTEKHARAQLNTAAGRRIARRVNGETPIRRSQERES